jgi:hypothetical protein
MKLGPTVALCSPLLFVPLLLGAHGMAETEQGPASEDGQGGDGDPGTYDPPLPPAPDHPVARALDSAPWCEGEAPNWAEVMQGISAQEVRAAIDEGVVELGQLNRAIKALAVIGSGEDLESLWGATDALAWLYVVDAVDAVASDEEVLAAQEQVAGAIRRDVLVGWGRRTDLPEDVLDAALVDPDPRVRRHGARLALASNDAARVDKGLDACASDPEVAAVAYICP